MNEQTPLEEVAKILPPNGAKMLTEFDIQVQIAVLAQIRTVVATLETFSITLDPVQLGVVLDLFVGSLAPYADALYKFNGRKAP
jgi:hypothetical protein